MAVPCPLCGVDCPDPVLERIGIPVMQNVVYRTRAEAQESRRGSLNLSVCANCGFAFNSQFDERLLQYDVRYDNTVRSATFTEYYAEIAHHLDAGHSLDGKFVVDIGCGKGSFLELLCKKFSRCQGLGIDPSVRESQTSTDNLKFIRDIVRPEHFERRPDLVLCRHVLEHIPDPIAFLKSLHETLPAGVPFFFEVPTLDWIIEAGAFWDFCYEHCNYFTAKSFVTALDAAGFRVSSHMPAFGGQYLWAEGVLGDPMAFGGEARDVLFRAQQYSRTEKRLLEAVCTRLRRAVDEGTRSVLWGMATKGVLFANLCDPDRLLVDTCVDKNEAKQGFYIAGSGHRIDAPTVLSDYAGQILDVYVMNPNYAREIKEECDSMGVNAKLLDPGGQMIA